MKYIGIIGTRKRNTRTDYCIVKDAFFEIYEEGDIIVSGHCKQGGDAFAEKIAFDYGIPILLYPPKKGKTKKESIGYLFARNTLVAEQSDIIIACIVNPSEPLELIYKRKTGGTEDTIRKFLGKIGFQKYHSDNDISLREDMKERVIIC